MCDKIASATPSSSFVPVTQAADFLQFSVAFPIAMPYFTASSILLSLSASPNAIASSGEIPSLSRSHNRVLPFPASCAPFREDLTQRKSRRYPESLSPGMYTGGSCPHGCIRRRCCPVFRMLRCKLNDILHRSPRCLDISCPVLCRQIADGISDIRFLCVGNTVDDDLHDHFFSFSYSDRDFYGFRCHKALVKCALFADRINSAAIGCDQIFHSRVLTDHLRYRTKGSAPLPGTRWIPCAAARSRASLVRGESSFVCQQGPVQVAGDKFDCHFTSPLYFFANYPFIFHHYTKSSAFFPPDMIYY